MGDSYRPSERARRREDDDYDYPERSYGPEYRDYDSEHRRQREFRGRSRSPRMLDYDDGPDRRDRVDEERKYRGPDGGYGRGDGPGLRRHHENRSPLRYEVPAERRPRYNPEMEYRHYGHDDYPVRPANHGETDGAKDDQPNVFLLVRGLKESSTEDLFAKGMEKLYAGFENSTIGATPKSIYRVFRIRDKRTDQRMGHGFVQYHTIDDAIAAMKRAREMQRNGERLTISSQEFSIAYAHYGVFPHSDFGRPERNERFMFWGHEKTHKYNDDRYYPFELVDNEKSPHQPVDSSKGPDDSEKKSKKANRDTLENKSKKRKAPGAVPAVLDYYQRKQAELREEDPDAAAQESNDAKQNATGVNAISTADMTLPDASSEEAAFSDQQTFAHEGKQIVCHLCNSQFNSRDHVIRHVKESAMHAKHLRDEGLVDRAYKRMANVNVDPESTIRLPVEVKSKEPVKETIQTEYRDRAAERRKEEAKAGGAQKVGFSLKGKGTKPAGTNTSARNSDSEAEKGTAQPTYGKGMGMLQKAGWSAGQGLGAEGSEGIAAPIETNMYAQGVGLGHEGSKRGDAAQEAARSTDGNSFLEGTRDLFRKRYESMQ